MNGNDTLRNAAKEHDDDQAARMVEAKFQFAKHMDEWVKVQTEREPTAIVDFIGVGVLGDGRLATCMYVRQGGTRGLVGAIEFLKMGLLTGLMEADAVPKFDFFKMKTVEEPK